MATQAVCHHEAGSPVLRAVSAGVLIMVSGSGIRKYCNLYLCHLSHLKTIVFSAQIKGVSQAEQPLLSRLHFCAICQKRPISRSQITEHDPFFGRRYLTMLCAHTFGLHREYDVTPGTVPS